MEAPVFFVPDRSSDEQEAEYADLAKVCNCLVPPLGKRIYSIQYKHDSVNWIATVGQTLRGKSLTQRRRGKEKYYQETSHGDPATVLAIFDASPCFMVFTDGGFASRSRTAWANPFMAGKPDHVEYFTMAAGA